MEYIKIGQIVNTHGIKGELRILSDFKFKDSIFVPGKKLYFGKELEEVTIEHYRIHKNYDMVLLTEYHDINDVIIYKGDDVYVKRDTLEIDGILDEDLIGLSVYAEGELIGVVTSIMKNKANDILVIGTTKKHHLVPNIPEFIREVDLEQQRIVIHKIEGLLNED